MNVIEDAGAKLQEDLMNKKIFKLYRSDDMYDRSSSSTSKSKISNQINKKKRK